MGRGFSFNLGVTRRELCTRRQWSPWSSSCEAGTWSTIVCQKTNTVAAQDKWGHERRGWLDGTLALPSTKLFVSREVAEFWGEPGRKHASLCERIALWGRQFCDLRNHSASAAWKRVICLISMGRLVAMVGTSLSISSHVQSVSGNAHAEFCIRLQWYVCCKVGPPR